MTVKHVAVSFTLCNLLHPDTWCTQLLSLPTPGATRRYIYITVGGFTDLSRSGHKMNFSKFGKLAIEHNTINVLINVF